jgi:hypothetical protein
MEDFKKAQFTSLAAISEISLGGNILDMLKIEKQRNSEKSYRSIYNKFVHNRNLFAANFHGLVPWGIVLYGSRGFIFGGTHNYFNRNLPIRDKIKKDYASNIIAGSIEGFLTSPLSMMRVRTAENVTNNTKIYFDYRKCFKTSPLGSLKRGADWGLRSFFYNHLKNKHNDQISAFFSGIIASIITTPIDRMLPLMQQNKTPHNIISHIIKNPSLLFSGITFRLLHAGWHTLFIYSAINFTNVDFHKKY